MKKIEACLSTSQVRSGIDCTITNLLPPGLGRYVHFLNRGWLGELFHENILHVTVQVGISLLSILNEYYKTYCLPESIEGRYVRQWTLVSSVLIQGQLLVSNQQSVSSCGLLLNLQPFCTLPNALIFVSISLPFVPNTLLFVFLTRSHLFFLTRSHFSFTNAMLRCVCVHASSQGTCCLLDSCCFNPIPSTPSAHTRDCNCRFALLHRATPTNMNEA